MLIDKDQANDIFPITFRVIGPKQAERIYQSLPESFLLLALPELLHTQEESHDLPPYSYDIANIEANTYLGAQNTPKDAFVPTQLCVNPTLSLIETSWQGLTRLFDHTAAANYIPAQGQEIILSFRHPVTKKNSIRPATTQELLALKIVVEDLNRREVAQAEHTTIATLDTAIELAIARGLILKPSSTLIRNSALFAPGQSFENFLVVKTFTLQWHITQACDLHCKHCYDRSPSQPVSLAKGQAIMDQFYDFCQDRNVHGQITFTGGNPLLHANFFELYQGAVDRGFMTAILGNPTSLETINKIKGVQAPEFYQVSLEGLEEHNNYIRGQGHFARVLQFLDTLKEAGIYSMVMLTLTRDNMAQVLPLADMLRDKVDLFTFNRLSATGEGAELLTPSKNEYKAFLEQFVKAEQSNPVLANKDNMINIIRAQENRPLFGGCAGFGCGAAFNFVSLLPGGEVHACRKFNSPIGNIHTHSLAAIYDSKEAASYRKGPQHCQGCPIRHACGGCLAVIDSQGLDYTQDQDPCCFIE